VVFRQPDLEEVLKSPVLGNVLRTKMTVIINDRLRGGKLMVEAPRRLIGKKKIVGEKAFHVPLVGKINLPFRANPDCRFKP
jgi:hypothetical protein